MELKWLEDLIAVAEKGHFARAAQERFITQSALSRRIQSLESWTGTELLDRSQHPIQLTPAGLEFIRYAREIVSRSYEGRAVSSVHSRLQDKGITIACLHTLALNYIPTLVHNLQKEVGHFSTTIFAEARSIEEYLTGLFNRNSDFFICYGHPGISLDVDLNAFPRIEIDEHWMRLFVAKDHQLLDLDDPPHHIPYLQYSAYTYMSRVAEEALKTAPFRKNLRPVYRASLAESLLTATQKGFGLSCLPQTVITPSPEACNLRQVTDRWSTKLSIRVYRSTQNNNPIVNEIWDTLKSNCV